MLTGEFRPLATGCQVKPDGSGMPAADWAVAVAASVGVDGGGVLDGGGVAEGVEVGGAGWVAVGVNATVTFGVVIGMVASRPEGVEVGIELPPELLHPAKTTIINRIGK
jgi:hypothetical protein